MKALMTRGLGVVVAVAATFAVSAVPAFASGAPIVETKAATSIGETSATLNGGVNPNGAETKYWFEYGTAPLALTKKTAEASAGSGTIKLEENKIVSELSFSTTYYYRIVAKNVNGTTFGAEQHFLTKGLPDIPGPTEANPVTFKVVLGHLLVEEEKGGMALKLKCEGENTGEGSITSPQTLKMRLVLKNCGITTNGVRHLCKSGTTAGEIVAEEIPAQPVYISKATKEVGLLLEPQPATHANPMMNFVCDENLGHVSQVTGSIIMPVTPVNVFTEKLTGSLLEKEGIQNVKKYEMGNGEKVEAHPFTNLFGYAGEFTVQGGLEDTLTLQSFKQGTNNIFIELKA